MWPCRHSQRLPCPAKWCIKAGHDPSNCSKGTQAFLCLLPHLQQQNDVCSGLKLTAPSEDQLKLLGHPAANASLSDAGAPRLGLSCDYLSKLGMLPEVLQLLHSQHSGVLSVEPH